ncbi:AbrB/MazE/SpoVT family DNA-binding domain-containing protein [Streptomyces sp. NPDC048419]|uniref:AbrB/MazE/SpoVT family DNA-binding domain-containing protein n=1 Tax=Streptomyces sp. NPDC048419 TaxID=3365547 RepID=UPI00371928DC
MMETGAQETRVKAQLRDKGQLTLPTEVRRALHIESGDDVEFVVSYDSERHGVMQVQVRGLKTVLADQAWFWTDEWQAGEREASDEIARSEGTVYGSAEEMFDALGVKEAE